jgi:hypothetical protein
MALANPPRNCGLKSSQPWLLPFTGLFIASHLLEPQLLCPLLSSQYFCRPLFLASCRFCPGSLSGMLCCLLVLQLWASGTGALSKGGLSETLQPTPRCCSQGWEASGCLFFVNPTQPPLLVIKSTSQQKTIQKKPPLVPRVAYLRVEHREEAFQTSPKNGGKCPAYIATEGHGRLTQVVILPITARMCTGSSSTNHSPHTDSACCQSWAFHWVTREDDSADLHWASKSSVWTPVQPFVS